MTVSESTPVVGRFVAVWRELRARLAEDREVYLREAAGEYAKLAWFLVLAALVGAVVDGATPGATGPVAVLTDPLVLAGLAVGAVIVFCKPAAVDTGEINRFVGLGWIARTSLLFGLVALLGTRIAAIAALDGGMVRTGDLVVDVAGGVVDAVLGVDTVLIPLVAGTAVVCLLLFVSIPVVVSAVIGGIVGVVGALAVLEVSVRSAVTGLVVGAAAGGLWLTAYLELDARVVDRGGIAAAMVGLVPPAVFAAEPAAAVGLAGIAGGVCSGLRFDADYSPPARAPRPLRAMHDHDREAIPGYGQSYATTERDPDPGDLLGYVLEYPLTRDVGVFFKGGYYLLVAPLLLGLPVLYLAGYLFRVTAAAYHEFDRPPTLVLSGWHGQVKEGAAGLAGIGVFLFAVGPVVVTPVVGREATGLAGAVRGVYGPLGIPVPLVDSTAVAGAVVALLAVVLPAVATSYAVGGRLRSGFHLPRIVALIGTRAYPKYLLLQAGLVLAAVLPVVGVTQVVPTLTGFGSLLARGAVALLYPPLLWYLLVASATAWGHCARTVEADRAVLDASWGVRRRLTGLVSGVRERGVDSGERTGR